MVPSRECLPWRKYAKGSKLLKATMQNPSATTASLNRMKRWMLGLVTASICTCAAHAGNAKVTWQEPDNYTDIREGNDLRDSFRQALFSEFELLFDDLARQLPDGHVLDVTVTDVDLAGEVNAMHFCLWRDIRVIKPLYWPRMSFDYKLTDGSGQMLVSGHEDIKDMAFFDRGVQLRLTRFGFEERMLRDWFRKMQREARFPDRRSSSKASEAAPAPR